MGREKEATSTDKLLDLIRDGGSAISPGLSDYAPVGTPVKAKSAKIFTNPFLSLNYWQSRTTVGVDIGYDAIRLVKAKAGADAKSRLLDYELVPLPPGVTKGSQEAGNLLKDSLNAFCGDAAKVDIWTSLPAVNVEVRCILIPKVPFKQIPKTVYWSAKKEGMSLDEKERIFDYEVQEEIYDQGVPKLSVMVYTSLRQEVEDAKRLFSRAGWPLTGVTIIPFAIQNLLRTEWLKPEVDTVATLFVGNDYSRIDIYARGNLVMTRGIKTGTGSLVESFIEGYNERWSLFTAGRTKAPPKPVNPEAAREILVNLFAGHDPMTGIAADYDLREEDVLPIILPAIDRLARQVERTFDHYSSTTGRNRVQSLYYSSVIGSYEPLLNYLNAQLGVKVSLFPSPLKWWPKRDFDEAGVFERVPYSAAIGLALSDINHTPNMIFTFKDKIEKESIGKINKLIFVSFISLVVICTVIFIYLGKTVAESKAALASLEREIPQMRTAVDKNTITRQFALLQEKNRQIMAYGDRNLSLATVAELTALTPPEVKLIKVAALFKDPSVGPEKVETKPPPAAPEKTEMKVPSGQGNIVIEGIVEGANTSPEMILAEYALRLDKSPLFSQAAIQNTSLETAGGKKILHFTIQLKFE